MDFIQCKNFRFSIVLAGSGVLLASAFLFLSAAYAQIGDTQSAISDLSSATGQDITSEEEAKAVCDQEQYWEVCADIGKKHNLYTEGEMEQVDAFLSEVKGQVLEDIKACRDEECLIRVANALALKVQVNNPTLAANLKLTTTVIEEKNAVVQAAKEVGVSFRDCESMNPDTAPVDLLRKCARLAKDSRVQQYIPEDRRVLAEQFEDSTTLKLREALAAGRYQCGDNTLEGCGNYCLNPTGTVGIPPVCAQIASDIFGEEGVKQLEAAHLRVGQVKDYYAKKFILILPDGNEIVGERQIKARCDQAFSNRNLAVARACGSFAVKNGFATQTEVDKGLKLMESFSQRGQNVKFDDCLANPTACRDFLPEDERARFDAGSQIFEIMKEEIGFDPSLCERGAVDQAIGMQCFEGSRKALVRIESMGLANQSQDASFIIEEIKGHVAEGERMAQRKDEFQQTFAQEGGPGGCSSEAECYNYCSDPANGPECISFGAKHQIFRGEDVTRRFNQYNQNIQKPGLTGDYNDQYSFPPYPNQGPFPPGQIQGPGFVETGSGYVPFPGTGPYPQYPGPGPVGPSPECFAAIQSGDYARAKTVCVSSVPPPTRPGPVCPLQPYVECPAGQYHESYRNVDGCWIDGPCKPMPTSTSFSDPKTDCAKAGGSWDEASRFCKFSGGQNPGDANSCPSFAYSRWDDKGARYCYLNEGGACQYNYPAYMDRANYSYSNCPFGDPVTSPYPIGSPNTKPQCSDGIDNDKDGRIDYPADSSCYGPDDWDEWYPQSGGPSPIYSPGSGGWINKSWKFKDGYTQYSSILNRTDGEYTTYVNSVYNDCLNKYFAGWKPGGGDDSNWKEFGIPVCSSTIPEPLGDCGENTTQNSCYAQPGCNWFYPPAGGQGYCMGDDYVPPIYSPTYSPYPTTTGASGMKNCFYPNATKNGQSLGWTVWCEADYYNCHLGDPSGESVSLNGLSLGAPSSCESGYEGQGCNNNNFCDSNETYASCPNDCGGTTYSPQPTASSCSQSLKNLLGDGCHWMYSDSSGRSVYCDGPMTKSAKEGDSVTKSGCYPEGGTYSPSPYPTYSPYPGSGSCPSGYHYHEDSGGYCINDQENYSGTCYNSSGTTTITCPQSNYTSCPSGQWWDSATSSCKSDTTYGNCSGTNQSSCTSVTNCYWDSANNYCFYNSDGVWSSYTPYPSCPSDQWWDSATSSCKSNSTSTCGTGYYWDSGTSTCKPNDSTTFTPTPTVSYTPTPTPIPTTDPSAACSGSGGTWDGSSCVYPTQEQTFDPSTECANSGGSWDGSTCVFPETSYLYRQNMTAHCQQLGRTWNGEICQANGLFARIYETYTYSFANILKVFGF